MERSSGTSSKGGIVRTVEQVRVDETGSGQIDIDQSSFSPFRPIKDSISEGTVYYINQSQYSISETSPIAVTAFHPSSFPSQHGSIKIGSRKIAVDQTSKAKIDLTQVSSNQINSFQSGLTQIPFIKVSPTQVNVSQGSVNTSQSNLTEVSFPSSITSQQFINSHDLLHPENWRSQVTIHDGLGDFESD